MEEVAWWAEAEEDEEDEPPYENDDDAPDKSLLHITLRDSSNLTQLWFSFTLILWLRIQQFGFVKH